MKTSQASMAVPDPQRLKGIRRGIEKEGLRVLPSGSLALTPHPLALGSALTHPHITTDYSESQIELITGARAPSPVDRKSTRLNSSHSQISYAVFCLKKKKK